MSELDYFVNPYTFAELRNKKTLCKVAPDEKKLTGRISCSLITKTQIAVPDLPDGQDKNGIDKAPFFRVDGKAVIPGSGIRGVIRNVYEALTNSCMHINDKDDDFFSSRQNKQAPGLIACEADGFVLYEAQRIRITLGLSLSETDEIKCNMGLHKKKIEAQEKQLSGFKIGDAIYFPAGALKTGKTSTGHISNKNVDDLRHGYYMKADSMITGQEKRGNITHNNPGIFVKGTRLAVLDSRTMNLLALNIKAYEPKTVKDRKQQYSECYEKMKSGKTMLPVWYFRDGNKFYLAPSQMSRSYFFNKPRDMLEKMGYTACTVRNSQCEACALFGMVGLGKDGEAASSRVRFGDAVCENTDCFDKFYVLPILGNPRLSSFEYYLINKNHDYENNEKNNYYKPIDPDQKDTVLSGRKFYWHHKGKVITEDDANSINVALEARDEGKDNFSSKGSCFELVKSGQTFTFNVYFDGITEGQLKKLLFSLNFGENDPDSELCHKIGHGKPVGLGSVKIVVNEVVLREFGGGKYSVSDDVKKEYFAKSDELFNEKDAKQVLHAVDMNAIPDSSLIMYPIKRRDGDDAAFKWFAANRNSLTTDPGTIAFKRRLPHIMADDQKLPMDIKEVSEHQPIEQLQGKSKSFELGEFSNRMRIRDRRNEEKPPKRNKKDKKRNKNK